MQHNQMDSFRCMVDSLTMLVVVHVAISLMVCCVQAGDDSYVTLMCEDLQIGQYTCIKEIDPENSELINCSKERRAEVSCETVPGLTCDSGQESNLTVFRKEVPCVYTNSKTHRTAVLLSIFLGMVGADRFYLGYHAIGLLKLCTMGLLFVGQFVDFILIATQVVGPADSSDYVMGSTPRFSRMWVDNETYFHSSDL